MYGLWRGSGDEPVLCKLDVRWAAASMTPLSSPSAVTPDSHPYIADARTFEAVHQGLIPENVAGKAVVAVLMEPPPCRRHHARAVLPAVLRHTRGHDIAAGAGQHARAAIAAGSDNRRRV